MKWYRTITVLPDTEIPGGFLMSKVMQNLHIAFVNAAQQNNGKYLFGISFPEYDILNKNSAPIGEKISIFSDSKEAFEVLNMDSIESKIGSDYIHMTGIRPVPAKRIIGYEIYSRVHAKASAENKARRFAKRHDVSYEDAIARYDEKHYQTDLPFVNMKSESTGEKFMLFIKRTEKDRECLGEYNSYGLSNVTTVPKLK